MVKTSFVPASTPVAQTYSKVEEASRNSYRDSCTMMCRQVQAVGILGLLALLGLMHITQRSEGGIVSLLVHCCKGTGNPVWTLPGEDLPHLPEAKEEGDGGDSADGGWRWIKQRAHLRTPSYYDHPLSTIGALNPYRDLPRVKARGLPDMSRDYLRRDLDNRAVSPVQVPGQRTVFSSNRAEVDLAAMKEFGLVSNTNYNRKRSQIDGSSHDPFLRRHNLPQPGTPEGWNGPSKMCRDVRSDAAQGLNGRGYAKINTLRCCSFLCQKTQWQSLRQGQSKWGYGMDSRWTKAVDTGGAGKLADGTDRYLCRSCAWYEERSWDTLGMHELSKMDGHLHSYTVNVSTVS